MSNNIISTKAIVEDIGHFLLLSEWSRKLNYPSLRPTLSCHINPITCLDVPLTHSQCVRDLYGYRVTRSDVAPCNVWFMLFLIAIRSYGHLPVGTKGLRPDEGSSSRRRVFVPTKGLRPDEGSSSRRRVFVPTKGLRPDEGSSSRRRGSSSRRRGSSSRRRGSSSRRRGSSSRRRGSSSRRRVFVPTKLRQVPATAPWLVRP